MALFFAADTKMSCAFGKLSFREISSGVDCKMVHIPINLQTTILCTGIIFFSLMKIFLHLLNSEDSSNSG